MNTDSPRIGMGEALTPTLPPLEGGKLPKRSYRRSTLPEQIAIRDALDEALITNDDGTVQYKPGHNDDSIARAIDPTLTAGHVAYVRKELFGALRTANPLQARLALMEARIATLEAQVEVLTKITM